MGTGLHDPDRNAISARSNRGRRLDGIPDGLLFIGGDSPEARRIFETISGDGHEQIEWAHSVAEGLERLRQPGVTSILLRLILPDATGIDAFERTAAAAGPIPILVLCDDGDESTGRLAVEGGADAFLLSDRFDRYSVARAVASLREHRLADDALFEAKERAEVTLNSIGDGVLCTDVAGNVTYLNPVAETMTGWLRAQAEKRPLDEILNVIDGSTRHKAPNVAELAIQRNATVTLAENCVLVRRDGYESAIEDSAAPIHDRTGQTTGAVIVFHDVSAAREMSLRLSHLAQHDCLTDLPNRLLLRDRVQQAISLARRHARRVAVLFVDLDRFKHVNDSLGHVVGDQLLKEVAARLTGAVRESDTVGRQSGDEFVVVLSDLESAASALATAAKLLSVLTAPYQIGVHNLRVPASIGISIYPDDAHDPEMLLCHADMAMYCAKENGRNNVQVFREQILSRAADRQFIEAGLRGALDGQEFSLSYQPKIDLRTQAVVGVEALLRWKHPERGLIPPAQFIPVAEDTGLMLPIGQWVVREACRQSRVWLDAGLPPIPVAVNVSAMEFRSHDFADAIQTTLYGAGVAPQFLELEVTESVLMKHAESTVSVLRALKAIGVLLTVDDFGTGYSSLSYLSQFPIDRLKVDQSFVREIPWNSDGAAIVRAVITMGASLNKRVIAEGVETREQVEFLTAAGCDEAQGDYFRHPMQAEQFGALLDAGVGTLPVY